jgi:hypothetical protein
MKKTCIVWAKGGTMTPLTAGKLTGAISQELQFVAGTFVALQKARNLADYEYGVPQEKVDAVSKVEDVKKAFRDWTVISGTPEATVFLTALMLERYYKDREKD